MLQEFGPKSMRTGNGCFRFALGLENTHTAAEDWYKMSHGYVIRRETYTGPNRVSVTRQEGIIALTHGLGGGSGTFRFGKETRD
jgi:hypothetical protein